MGFANLDQQKRPQLIKQQRVAKTNKQKMEIEKFTVTSQLLFS